MKKTLKIFAISTPIAVCVMQWLDVHTRNTPSTSSILQADEQKMRLDQVQVIFRHGARTPISWSKERFQDFTHLKQHVWDKNKLATDLPGMMDVRYTVELHDGTDPSGPKRDEDCEDKMEGGCTTGLLTRVGKQQLYELGNWLSEEYIVNERLMSPSDQKNGIYVRSSYYQRTIQSAVCLLAGLYEKGLTAAPICIETKEADKEDLVPNLLGCTNFIKWFNFVDFEEVRSSQEEEAENYINGLIGKVENKKNAQLTEVNDLIRCRRAHGLSVPQYLLDNEEMISRFEMKTMQKVFGKGNMNVIRNCVGSFLETVCSTVTEGKEGSSRHKMFLYSAHDWTILSLLVAFGVDVDDWPPFASHLIIELYRREDDKSFIRILYNGKPIILDNDSNQEYLPEEKFLSLMKVYRVQNFDEDCGNV